MKLYKPIAVISTQLNSTHRPRLTLPLITSEHTAKIGSNAADFP